MQKLIFCTSVFLNIMCLSKKKERKKERKKKRGGEKERKKERKNESIIDAVRCHLQAFLVFPGESVVPKI